MFMTACIYKITNLVNGKLYIGQAHDFAKRRDSHLKAFKRCLKGTINFTPLYKAFAKYGVEKFLMEPILSVLDVQYIGELERLLIIEYDVYKHGYNATHGGEGSRGCKWSPESRLRASIARTGEGSSRWGKTFSEETKKKMSASHKGYKASEATKLKHSLARSGDKHPLYGIGHSEDSKLKISFSRRIKYGSRIVQDNITFLSIKDYCEYYGIHETTCRYRIKTGKLIVVNK